MNPSYVSPTLLVAVYVFMVAAGSFRVINCGLTAANLASLALNSVVLLALLLVAGAWARKIGIFAGWLRVVLGGIIVVVGLWQLLTLNVLSGLYVMALGLVAGVGLGYWTVSVLRAISAARTSESV